MRTCIGAMRPQVKAPKSRGVEVFDRSSGMVSVSSVCRVESLLSSFSKFGSSIGASRPLLSFTGYVSDWQTNARRGLSLNETQTMAMMTSRIAGSSRRARWPSSWICHVGAPRSSTTFSRIVTSMIVRARAC